MFLWRKITINATTIAKKLCILLFKTLVHFSKCFIISRATLPVNELFCSSAISIPNSNLSFFERKKMPHFIELNHYAIISWNGFRVVIFCKLFHSDENRLGANF